MWALRGLSLLIDLGAAQRPLAVASWIAFGAVLTELAVRRLQVQKGR